MASSPAQNVRGAPPWLLTILLLLALSGAGYYVWWSLIRTPTTLKADAVAVEAPRGGFNGRPSAPPLPEGKDPGPTLLTLQLTNISPESAFQQLAKAGGLEILRSSSLWDQIEKKTVSLSLKDQSFWPAFFDLCLQSGVCFEAGYNEAPRASRNSVQLQPDPSGRMRCPVVFSGSFAVILRQIRHTATADYAAQNPPRHDLTLDVMLLAEPKIPVLEISYTPDIQTAVDDAGNSLVPAAPRYRGYGGPPGNWHNNLQINLTYPPKPAKRIARLAATARVVTASIQPLEIANVLTARDVASNIEGMQIVFKGLSKTGNGYNAALAISGPSDRRSMRFLTRGSMLLMDAQGREYSHSGNDSSGSPDGFTFNAQFSARGGIGQPAKLVLSVPNKLQEITVPFTFMDLPMP